MERRKIDMTHFPRRAHFDYFRQMSNPWAGVTVQVDITEIMEICQDKPFFLTILYLISRAANRVPEFRQRICGDEIVEYAYCPTSHTEAKPDGTYAYCVLSSRDMSWEEYLIYGRKQQEKARYSGTIEEEDASGYLFISCLPWLHYTSLTQPTTNDPNDSNPRIVFGKYDMQNGRVYLPVSVLIHHALADGRHISQFYDNLSDEIERLVRQTKEQNL